jgi:hypothetical protein
MRHLCCLSACLQDSELPVWRQLQLRCASALEGKDALQRGSTAQTLDAADELQVTSPTHQKQGLCLPEPMLLRA